MTGIEHFEIAEKILANLGGEQDADWSLALATRALAHATLAGAARDYGRHVSPRPITGNANIDAAVPAVRPAGNYEFIEELKSAGLTDELAFQKAHRTELHEMLQSEFHVQRD